MQTPHEKGGPVNKVVVRYGNGRLLKGSTNDFFPTKSVFHVAMLHNPPSSKPVPVEVRDLKAIFFVKDFEGNPTYRARQDFEPNRPVLGRKIQVTFKDGEILVGTTQGYQPGRPGFFLIPADGDSNTLRCYVISAATREITLL